MNIIELTDDEILTVAEPMWIELVRASNEGEYGKFIRNFDYSLIQGLNEVEVGKQFAKSELTRSLSEVYDYLGIIRRGEHVTVLYRVRSTKKEVNGSAVWSSVPMTKMRSKFMAPQSSDIRAVT